MLPIQDVKAKILQQTPLSTLIAHRVEISRRGPKQIGLCPFHAEKTPSFHIFDDHYHCFGCGAHGDAISWVQHFEGLGFIDALKWLGNKFGVDVSDLERSADQLRELKKNARRQEIMALAQEFFVTILASPEGDQSRRYLQERGFSEEKIKEFGFGFASHAPAKLLNSLLAKNYRISEINECSLIAKWEGRYCDFFRGRITIPIKDPHGKIIAFGGRTLIDGAQKYKNSKYDKSSILFGMDSARAQMRNRMRAVVVEGYLDALQLWQHGLGEAVACQGTALTAEHVRQLAAATGLVYLLFDGDKAGRQASLKVLPHALKTPNLTFKVVNLPEGEDPDSLVKAKGADYLEELFKSAQDLISFSIEQKLKNSSATSIPEILKQDIFPWLSHISDQLTQDYLLHQISQKTGINPFILRQELKLTTSPQSQEKVATKKFDQNKEIPPPLTPLSLSPLVFELMGHLYFANPGELDLEEIKKFIQFELEEDPFVAKALNELCLKLAQDIGQTFKVETHTFLNSPQLANIINDIESKRRAFQTDKRQKLLTRLQLLYKQNKIKQTMSALKSQLSLSRIKDSKNEAWLEIAKMINDLNRKLQQINNQIQILH